MTISKTDLLTDNQTYAFTLDNTFAVQSVKSKGDTLYEYRYMHKLETKTIHMQVLMKHDSQGVPIVLDTITVLGIDYIPFVCKLTRAIKAAPAKINLTPKDQMNGFHVYNIDIVV